MYSGVVFDFDGVLYDSEKHWNEIENCYLISHIPSWNRNEYKHLIGRPLPEAYKHLKSRGLQLTQAEYFAGYHEMAMKLYSDLAKPIHNVDVLIRKLTGRNAKIAIASSSKRVWINTALQNSKLPVAIGAIVSSDDPLVARGKPAPDIYLRAAEILSEHPSKLIAIEDSKNGIASAKAAGLYCFGLRNGFNDAQDLAEADSIVDGYGTESITTIMSLFI